MKILMPFSLTGLGGVRTFANKFKQGMEAEGHEVIFDFDGTDYDILFIVVQCPRKYVVHAQKHHKKIVQRLDGTFYWTAGGLKFPLLNLKAGLIRRFATDVTIYQSEFSRLSANTFLGRKQPDEYKTIYNGVDLTLFTPDGATIDGLRDYPTQKLFFSASVFRRQDQILPLLAAIDAYRRKYGTDYKLLLAGTFSGPVANLPDALKDRDDIQLLGPISNTDLPAYERSVDVFLFTHLNPPCPNNIIESLACGLPVCGIADGAMPELITHGQEGMLLPAHGNGFWRKRSFNAAGFADNMHAICVNREKYSQACVVTARERFSLIDMVRAYSEVFTLLVNKPYMVALFQPLLRRLSLNFGRVTQKFRFVRITPPSTTTIGSQALPAYAKEITRDKVTWVTRLRRWAGIPNVRVRFDTPGNLFFTYGCLVIGRHPYCVYLETGLALYNYDLGIAKNPLAQWIVTFLATRSQCRALIFMSEAAKKSFFATVSYPQWARTQLEAKSHVIYPVAMLKQDVTPKQHGQSDKELKLLFPGTFYMKGGLELVHAFIRLHEHYPQLKLTIVTALQSMKPDDVAWLQSLPGVTLLDATLSEEEMIDLYRTHDVFVLPTYRDGFGAVILEGLICGMPLIITDQYATSEMVEDGKNGFVYPNHPLKNYDPDTYRMFDSYSNPKDFYTALLQLQAEGKLKPVEDFLYTSIESYLKDPALLERHSRHSLELYARKFDSAKIAAELEAVFAKALQS